MKNVRFLFASLAVIAAIVGTLATKAANENTKRVMAWFEYQPTQSGGTANPANYHEISSTGCLNGSNLCAIRVEKNASTSQPTQAALDDIQDEIDAGTPIAGRVVFKP